MKDIIICNKKLIVKDYLCKEAGDLFAHTLEEYIEKDETKLWLYVNVTDRCNASCSFCVSESKIANQGIVSTTQFKNALKIVLPHIYGISFTGGEPMMYPELLDELIMIADDIVDPYMEIDIVTNGTNLNKLLQFNSIERLSTIHISRHSFRDEINNQLMSFVSPSYDEIKDFICSLNDPGKVVFNCVLQKGGIEKDDDVALYLDKSIEIGVQNNCFASMFSANAYCRDNYISPDDFPFISNKEYMQWNALHPTAQFEVWNRYHDYEYCRCLSGSYKNDHGYTRFYFRCPGNETAPDYCRQLVYSVENKLQDGFGSNRTVIWEK